MPIYGYACKICDHTLDELQKMADDALVDCPACGEPGLRRQLSAPRFRLKGQGWYETDFKGDNQRNLAGEKEATGTDEKSDAKPGDKTGDKTGDKSVAKPSDKIGDKASDKSAAKTTSPVDKKSDKTKSSSANKASAA
ncbi:MAG: zinc ribbon domain-containing protein [Proteobacteria bacterium]|nr:zinc ribbon domain-containing protein [Pseudomonadota bacterium]